MSGKEEKKGFLSKAKSFWRYILRHTIITLLAFSIVAFFASITYQVKPLDPLTNTVKEFSFTDIYYSIYSSVGEADTSTVITIVDLTHLINRADIAQAFEDIESCHPKVIGADMVFEVEDIGTPGANDSIVEIADKYKNIVWGTKLKNYSNEADSIGFTTQTSSFFKEYTDINEGAVNMPRGGLYDSMKRKVPTFSIYNKEKIPSICAQVANAYAGKNISGKYGELLQINFTPIKFRKIQPEDILSNKEYIEGQIVLFGALNDSGDMHWTPVDRIAGIELLAYGVNTILQDKEIQNASIFELCIISFLIVFLVQIIQTRYLSFTGGSSNLFVRFVVGSTYVMNILTFMFTSVFMFFGFLAFMLLNKSYSLGYALSVVAFLGTSRNMYVALKDYFVNKAQKLRKKE